MFQQPSRRNFLKITAASIASLFLPRSLLAKNPGKLFHFIHADSCNSWPVADPVAWSLANAHEPVLERAAEGLRKLTSDDGERILRLVVRRCGLNLLELRPEQVVVHHWSSHRADLRSFFKQHRLAHQQIEVVLRERKKEVVTTQHGDDFLFGDRFGPGFPLDLYRRKWANRFTKKADDWQAAPGTWSGFAWADLENNRIPWAALKSAWRRATPGVCLNCDMPTLLVNFGFPWTGRFNRTPRFVHICSKCRRSFLDESVDVKAWMTAKLDADVMPGFEMVWDRRVKRKAS